MADFVNLQVLGVPVLTYGLIGVTTAVLAYATSVGMGDTISKSMESLTEITESPMSALSNMNPLSAATGAATGEATGTEKSPETETPASPAANESGLDGLNPFASSEGEGEAKEKPAEEPPKETTGGKKRRKKTPKSKKAKRKNRSKKAKK